MRGEVDAIFVSGAEALAVANLIGAQVASEFGGHPDPKIRINNGTPRVLTVDAALSERRPDLALRLLEVVERAGRWAEDHPDETVRFVAREIATSEEAVLASNGPEVHRHLGIGPDAPLVEAIGHFKDFLLQWGFLPGDFDLGEWVDAEPSRALRAGKATAARSRGACRRMSATYPNPAPRILVTERHRPARPAAGAAAARARRGGARLHAAGGADAAALADQSRHERAPFEVAVGDLEDRASLRRAFEGVSHLFLLSPIVPALAGAADRRHRGRGRGRRAPYRQAPGSALDHRAAGPFAVGRRAWAHRGRAGRLGHRAPRAAPQCLDAGGARAAGGRAGRGRRAACAAGPAARGRTSIARDIADVAVEALLNDADDAPPGPGADRRARRRPAASSRASRPASATGRWWPSRCRRRNSRRAVPGRPRPTSRRCMRSSPR